MEISYKQKLNMRKFWIYTTTLEGLSEWNNMARG